MTFNYLPVIFLVSYIVFLQVHGQYTPCRPGSINNVTITSDQWLQWDPPIDNTCLVSYYLLLINDEFGHSADNNIYMILGTSMFVNFLEICESYYFNIVAVSDSDEMGPENLVLAKMPLPVDTDLTITTFRVSALHSGVYLEWEVPAQWRKCTDTFRVSVYDAESDGQINLYFASNNATITTLVPCTTYTFGVRAVYNQGKEGPFTSVRYVSPAVALSSPILLRYTLGRTTIDMTWQLESYSTNKCDVSALTVNALPSFRITYPISDQSNRPLVSIRLTDLQPNTEYVLNVTVINTAGVSEPTVATLQTLE